MKAHDRSSRYTMLAGAMGGSIVLGWIGHFMIGVTLAVGYAAVGGGRINEASAEASTIAGGESNEASGDYATIGGGHNITATGMYGAGRGERPNDAQ